MFETMTRESRKLIVHHWYYQVVLIISLLVPGQVSSAVATVQDYLEDARTLMVKGEIDAAVLQLKNALLLKPDDAGALLLLGKVHLESGDAASAEKEITRARELGVDAAEWKPLLGKAYLLSGRNDELLKEVTPEEQYPANVRADILQLQGHAWLAKRQFQEADEKFRAVLALQPDRSEALLGRARVAYQQQEKGKAAEFIDEVLRHDPLSADAWMLKGGLLSIAGDQKGAVVAYQRALEIAPDMLAAHAAKAASHIDLGEYEPALAEIAAIRGQSPDSYLAHYLEARVYFQKQNLNQALTSIHDALSVAPGYQPGQLLAGAIYYRKGQYLQAEEYFRPLWNAHPEDVRTAKLLAVSLVKTDQQAAAIDVLEKSVFSHPDDIQLLTILGSLYIRTGQEARGLEYLNKAAAVAPDSAAVLTQLAIGHMASGDTGQAITELKEALKLDSDLMQADMLLILVQLRQGKLEDALHGAGELVRQHPDSVVAQNLLGNAYFARKEYPAARDAYEKALVLDTQFVPASINLATIDQLEGDWASAERRYRGVLRQDEGNLQVLLELAKLAVEQGRKDDAIEFLNQARRHHPDEIKPVLLLSELYRQAQDTAKALELARSAISLDPHNPAVLEVLARAQLEAGDTGGGIKTLQGIAEITPSSAKLHYQIARLYLQQKNAAAARQSLMRAIDLQPDFPAAQATLGRLEIVGKNYAAAQDIASALQHAHPQAPDGYELAGYIHAAQGDLHQAVLLYEQAYELKESAHLAIGLFNAWRITGESEKAIAALRNWLVEHPEDNTVRMPLASFLQQQGKQDEAIEEYLQILAKQPDNITALNNITSLYQQQGSEKGIVYAERAYEIAPQRPDVIDTLGWLLVQKGEHQRGLVLLQEAVTKAPYLPEIRYHMAVALTKVGRTVEAREELERIIRTHKDFAEMDKATELLHQLGGA